MITRLLGNKVSGVDLITGLISVWELDETSGTTATDSHGSHNGTSYNVTVNQTGKLNKSYLFNDTIDYIAVTDHNDFSFTNGANDLPFSVSFWVNLNTLNDSSRFLSKWGSTPEREYLFNYDVNSSAIWFRVFNSDGASYLRVRLFDTDSGMNINTWHHLVFTYDGSENASGLNLYFDGSLLTQTRDEVGTYTGMTNQGSDLYLGNLSTSNSAYIHGKLDQTAMWNIELTQEQVTALYNSNNGLAYSSW